MPGPNLRVLATLGLLGAAACSGSISCGSCGGGPLNPIPGGFPAAAKIERVAQVRMTQRGLDFIEAEFQNLMQAYVRMDCGGPTDVPCPTGFRRLPGGQANPASCDLGQGVCVESLTSAPGPLIGFEIDRTEQSGATICRDELTDPNRRACYAWLRFEGLQLGPMAPNRVQATITAQLDTTDIPFRYDALGMDCVVRLNSAASGAVTQDLVANAQLGRWTSPSGVGGGQLQITIDSVDAMIADDDVDIGRDPVHGDFGDTLLCGVANLGVVKNALIPQLTDSLAGLVGEEVDKALGWRCGQPGDRLCPTLTTCNADGFCEEADGAVVPVELGLEGRMDFAALLAGFTSGRPGEGDLSFVVGGDSTADAAGLSISTLGGAEVVVADPQCAQVLPSPRLRPGWVAPPTLPTTDRADLDWDGADETPYMVAAGVSEAFMDQLIWTIYTTGLLCSSVSAYDVDLLNTGSLGLILPSLAQLTHSDRYPRNVFPARLSLHPSGEPQVRLGSGKISNNNGSLTLDEPLVELVLEDLTIEFYALIEERWARLMTVRLDLKFALGATVNAANEIEVVLGDLAMAVSDVHVTNSELLAEDPAELEMSIPALLQLALPSASGIVPPFALPTAADLGGFELDVLGIRGVPGPGGSFPNIAVYADLGFDPSQAPNLSLAVETVAEVRHLEIPEAAAFSVTHPGGPALPVVELALSGHSPEGQALEHQLRIDGGPWSPFIRSETLRLARPEWLAQGLHTIDVRARAVGAYRSLDPSPVALQVVIDAEGPRVQAELDRRRGGAYVQAYDVVSQDRLSYTLEVGLSRRGVQPDAEGFLAIEGLGEGARVALAVADEAGRSTTVVLEAGRPEIAVGPEVGAPESAGCRCVDPTRVTPWALGLVGLLALRRRR